MNFVIEMLLEVHLTLTESPDQRVSHALLTARCYFLQA
jgi:hypothetical protein